MSYIPFTEEQKRQANLVDLSKFLLHRGEPLIRSGKELHMGGNHSVTVHGNGWYDRAAETGLRAGVLPQGVLRKGLSADDSYLPVNAGTKVVHPLPPRNSPSRSSERVKT